MCGIVGIAGVNPVATRLLEALKRLEYRGYDSAGIATIHDREISRLRAEGKLKNLAARLDKQPLDGVTGIGHTRWATHGAPNENNAHPHATGRVALVHNGIIENYRELLEELKSDGYRPTTQTDTEPVAMLVTRQLERGADPKTAVANTLEKLRGAFGLVFLFKDHPGLLIAARQGSPLAIGHGDGENYFGSDAYALAPLTNKITYLEEGDWAAITPQSVTIYDAGGDEIERPQQVSLASAVQADKGNHRHFMAKEIHEQSETIAHTLSHFVDMSSQTVSFGEKPPFDFAPLERLTITACGTAYLTACVAKYWFERYARLAVDVDVASEFRYRQPPLEKAGVAMFISQSGETADTLAALRHCASRGQIIASIVNVAESTIARESSVVFPTLCGPEIAVASTKATTAQLTILAGLVIAAGRARGVLSADDETKMVRALVHLPRAVSLALALEPRIEEIARHLAKARDIFYLGRGPMYPIALEGALKLKEISYIHAEGYAAGELKHGPIALIEEDMPVIVVAPSDELLEKTLSNVQEVAARGARVVLITDEAGARSAGSHDMEMIVLPAVDSFVAPILSAIPVQLLAYHTAVHMGTDVDQPRNLAKSVTVE